MVTDEYEESYDDREVLELTDKAADEGLLSLISHDDISTISVELKMMIKAEYFEWIEDTL